MKEGLWSKLKLFYKTSYWFQKIEAKIAKLADYTRKVSAFLLVLSFVGQLFSFAGISFSSGPRDYDENAVIYGGAYSKSELISKIEKGDGKHTDIKKIFNTIGIYESDIKQSTTVDGVVYKDGTVKVGGKTVASGVLSAGRKNKPGSTKDPDLPIYWHKTSVNFDTDSLEAFVYLHNGSFVWAVVKSCGNPVVKTIRIKPQLEITKEIKKEGDKSWAKSIEVKPGDTIAYLIGWKNPGQITALSTYIRDSLPPYVTVVKGSAKLYDSLHPNGVTVDENALIKGGLNVGNTLPDNKYHYIRFQAKVAENLPAGSHTLINVAAVRAYNVSEKYAEAKATLTIQPQILPATIKGVKFNDLNGNGKKDSGEPLIEGVTIELIQNDKEIKSTTTNENGSYVFDKLNPGTYTVKEIIPSGWQNTTPDSVTVVLKSGETKIVDFGNQKIQTTELPAQIHGVKFNDLNNNGRKDDSESGLKGITINLYKLNNDDKVLVKTVTTDEKGEFHFINLNAGTYIVEEVVPDGWVATTPTSQKIILKSGDNKFVVFGNKEKEITPTEPEKPIPTLPKTGSDFPFFLGLSLILSSAYIYGREKFLLRLKLLQVA